MIQLRNLAYKAELSAARRLAARTGTSHEQALRAVLELAAGSAGLELLLAERGAHQANQAARAAARLLQRRVDDAARKARHDGPGTAWRAWFDGSAHPNPGQCGIGAVLSGPHGQHIEIARAAGYGNSGQAEYLALIAALETALDNSAHALTVYGDSQVVINDVNGATPAAASLAPYRVQALGLIAQLGSVEIRWLPRHKNGAADKLSQRAVAGLRHAP